MEIKSKMRLNMDIIADGGDTTSNLDDIKPSPVQIVTIKNKHKLFKGDEPANAIELIEVEEHGFDVVAQKDLYQVGEKVVFITPDYSLSDIPLFESFIKPNGDPKKSKLGSNNRIRAIKFNFKKENSDDVVYSQGILMPLKEVFDAIKPNEVIRYNYSPFMNDIAKNKIEQELTTKLNITKWEAPEDRTGGNPKGGQSKPFPEGLYKTDEDNINNKWGRITYPIDMIGSLKCDGSSITLVYKNGKGGICSRNLEVSIFKKEVTGRRNPTFVEQIKLWFGFKVDLNIYGESISDSDFIKVGLPYLKRLVEYCDIHGIKDIALRGELNGKGLKGSGNKNNPSSKDEPNIKFFGLDDYSGSRAVKMPEKDFNDLITALGFERCPIIFNQTFNSKEQIIEVCNNYFKENLVEGIVIRTLDSKFSCKFMSPDYDSKK